jgi:ribosome recycling factor
MEIEKPTTEKMEKSISSLKTQLQKVRTGRANVSMLDPVRVNYYGTPTPINQVAALSCPDAKSFLIAPWESNLLKEIESAIVKSDIGMTPANDGKVIRLKLPELTEDRRKDLAKAVKKIIEDARIAIRQTRREANEELKKSLKEKTISEDEQTRLVDKVQQVTDNYIKKVDDIGEDKEKDLMTV